MKKKFNFLTFLNGTLQEQLTKFDLIINATSLGLKNGEDFEFDFENLKSNAVYIDTVYNPIETKRLKNI